MKITWNNLTDHSYGAILSKFTNKGSDPVIDTVTVTGDETAFTATVTTFLDEKKRRFIRIHIYNFKYPILDFEEQFLIRFDSSFPIATAEITNKLEQALVVLYKSKILTAKGNTTTIVE